MSSNYDHKENEESEADHVDRIRDARFYRASNDTFNDNEKESAAIERGNRNEIYERQIYRNNRHNGKKIAKPCDEAAPRPPHTIGPRLREICGERKYVIENVRAR